jgi:hypothetical protein
MLEEYDEYPTWGFQGKLCECGCGKPTSIIAKSDASRGYVKGQPMRFVAGHRFKNLHRLGSECPAWKGGRTETGNYPAVYIPDHPKANSYGYVNEHIVIAEKALGKPLPTGAVVHHHASDQLVICQDKAYHNMIHRRMRAYEACGNADWVKCSYCATYDDPSNMWISKKSGYGFHRECQNKSRKARKANR